jgi:hypothetical protein
MAVEGTYGELERYTELKSSAPHAGGLSARMIRLRNAQKQNPQPLMMAA